MDSDFTTQAAFSLTRASQTNNFVSSKAYYDISFRTATAGAIKTIAMDFPAGTSVGSALLVEATGIGPGTLLASPGEILRYTVTNEVNVPANTIIRIQISNINNPPTPSASFTVSITTTDPANTPIDGPTPTLAYNMVQVGNAQIAPGAVTTTKIATGAVTTGDIANGAVTTPKIATSFAYQKNLADGVNGWTPSGTDRDFAISDPLLVSGFERIIINLERPGVVGGVEPVCGVTDVEPGVMTITCDSAPADGDILNYAVIIPTALPP